MSLKAATQWCAGFVHKKICYNSRHDNAISLRRPPQDFAVRTDSESPPRSQGADYVVGQDEANQEETLETKIRKTRPPPRVRISSSSQPGYVSLRLDGVAVTFRNQEVIKDATWEVKTGDRIGLVGPNGGWRHGAEFAGDIVRTWIECEVGLFQHRGGDITHKAPFHVL